MTSPIVRSPLGCLILLTASATALATDTEPQPIGRLFFTPEQRSELDQQAQTNTPAGEPQTNGFRFDGKVLRSNGSNTYWINGKPQTSPEGIPAQLQVGETVDVSNGKKRPLLDDGALRINKPQRPTQQAAKESRR